MRIPAGASRLARLSFFLGLGAMSALVAACSGSSTQLPTPLPTPDGSTDADSPDSGVPDATLADAPSDDPQAPDADAADAPEDGLWDVVYE